MKTIQDYKDEFVAIYNDMIAQMNVEAASVSIFWKLEKINGEWVKKPFVTISF